MGKAKFLVSIALIFVLLAGFTSKTADAKDERQLAEELAKQFKFYELAEEILLKEIARTDFTDKNAEVQYKYKCAESLRDVYKWHANQLDRTGESEKAKELREKADALITEWTEKRYGDDEQGQLFLAGQILTEGENLVDRAPFEDDLEKRAEILRRAEENYRRALAVYEQIAKKYKENIDPILMGVDQGDEEAIKKYNILKLSWYHWAKALYLLGKIGIEKKKNYKIALEQIDEISFELSTDAIAFYALLLQGDILFDQEKYSKAHGIFESVLSSLPKTMPDWNEVVQAEADRIRQEAYFKASESLMKLKKYEEAVNLMRKMIDIDYPTQSQDWYVKLARLLRAEAQIKMGEDPASVIKEESFVSFSKDPEEYFRSKYYDVLAGIGRFPELNLQTRILCARAAYDQNRFVDAVPIYQLALNQLTDDSEFERYAPEVYFRIGDSFQRTWRFAEAATALIEGAQKLVYLNFKYGENDEVPVHMQGNFDLKQKLMFMDDKGEYQIDLVRKIAVTLAEKAHKNATWVPDGTTNGTQAYEFARDIERRKSNIEGIVGGSEKSQQVNFQKEVYDKRFIPAWKRYRSNEKDANFFSTISGFNALSRVVGPTIYLNSLYLSADMMRIHYELLNENKVKNYAVYPEKTDWENSETFANGSRNYQGKKFFEWEKERIGEDNLLGISDNMKDFIVVYLDNILDPEVASQSRLLYYNKAMYFFSKFIFETILIDKPAFEATYEGIFDKDLQTIVDSFSKYVKRIYMKKIGMSTEDSEIKVATVFDEMTPSEIQVLMDDFSKALIDIGLIMRENPWQPKNGYLSKEIKDAQELLNPNDKVYKENEKKLEEYEKISYEIEGQITYFWSDFDNNFGIYFIDSKNEQNNKELQTKYRGRASVLLYLAFFVHLRHEQYFEAEQDYESYAKVFAEEIEKDDKRKETLVSMLNNLHNQFNAYNVNKFGRFIESYKLLSQIRADLLSSSLISMEDLIKSINYSALEDRTEIKGDEEVIVNDKENLLEALKDSETDEYYIVENTPFQNYILDIMKEFVKWASNGEKEKIVEYCKKFKFNLNSALVTYYTLTKEISIEGKDVLDEFMKELVKMGSDSTKTHIVVSQIYDSYLTVVYLNRQKIADEIEEVMNAYIEKYAKVGSRAAKYEYLYTKLKSGDKISFNTLRKVGTKLYDTKQYPEAIDFLQQFMHKLEGLEDKYIFKDGKPAPIADEEDLKFEIVVRSMLAECYLQVAKKNGSYSPDDENWRLAEFNLTRLFDFIRYRFDQQKAGNTDRISWEKYLDQYYYLNMENYKEVLELKAAYILNNGGKYTLDTDIRAYSVTAQGVIGEKIEEVDADQAAMITANRILWICHYLANQAPKFSPSQRKYEYIEKFKVYILIARIGNKEEYNKNLIVARDKYKELLGKNDLGTYVFFGDPDFSVEFKKLVRQVDTFITDRKLGD